MTNKERRITDEMVEAADHTMWSMTTDPHEWPGKEDIRRGIEAALNAAPDPGSPHWMCFVRDDGVPMFTRRHYCEHYECPGPHRLLIAGAEQPQEDDDG